MAKQDNIILNGLKKLGLSFKSFYWNACLFFGFCSPAALASISDHSAAGTLWPIVLPFATALITANILCKAGVSVRLTQSISIIIMNMYLTLILFLMLGGWLIKIELVEQTLVSVWILVCFSLVASLPGSLSELRASGAFDPNSKFVTDPKFSGRASLLPPVPPIGKPKFILVTALMIGLFWWVGEFSGHAFLQSPLVLFLAALALSALAFFTRKHSAFNSPSKA